ncbi:Flp family type IVb pilin [Aminobacter sp. P9b]|uniref:Pilus assembly protein Flp/PilA n=1 Tax=Aminobacter niigataensis TaxID=83265 RepID=A0ABR6L2F5_9HYPH|nr:MULTISPECIES: Flp family type IVb pilin [Aminobacter]AWC22431.1 Flp pilus assembly protein, pilin Flp [Aminobacter sp. MSH1]MBB4650250.1 pilus assembly protein Flp/PilA [Aminobacter niigataensis]CAI2933070.1 Flp pilus assembly protein, pilin Flp [Aminobacter niigataensis]
MIKRFLRDEGGATAIEYGLIAALIAVVMAGGFSQMAEQLRLLWGDNNKDIQQGLNRH